MRFICPLLVVKDIERSRRFYGDLLGEKIKCDFGENVTFESGFAIHLESHYLGLLDRPSGGITYGSHSFELYFESEELEEIQERLLVAGVPFVHPLREQPWRQRVMRFYDPDGHVLEIGEPLEALVRRLHGLGMTSAQIREATSLSIDFINAART